MPFFLRLLALLLIAFALAPSSVEPASSAETCKWFGTRPFCSGHCPAGWRYTGEYKSCVTGGQRRCCTGTKDAPPPSAGNWRHQCESKAKYWARRYEQAIAAYPKCGLGVGVRYLWVLDTCLYYRDQFIMTEKRMNEALLRCRSTAVIK